MFYCNYCNHDFNDEQVIGEVCPYCGQPDELEYIDEEEYNDAFDSIPEPTEEELEAMYEQHYYATQISNKYALYGAI